jgi:hypothetical protein
MRSFWTALNLLLCSSIALASFRYLLGVGPVAPIVAHNSFGSPWLVLHVAGAATALLLSPLQLIGSLRRRWPAFHRWLGRVYVVGCCVAGVAGLPLAFGSTAGGVARVPNLLIAELLLRHGRRRAASRSHPLLTATLRARTA